MAIKQESETWSKLRLYLNEPSEAHWKELWELLSTCDEDDKESLYAYVETHLDDWPDELRVFKFGDEYLRTEWPESLKTLLMKSAKELEIREYSKKASTKAVNLAHDERFAHLSKLHVSSRFGVKDICKLLTSPHYENLETLELVDMKHRISCAKAMVSATHLSKIKNLRMTYNHIDDKIAAILAQAPCLSQVNTLIIFRNKIGDSGATALAESAYLKNLVSLDICHNQISVEGALAFAKSDHLPNLKLIELQGYYFSTSEMNEISEHMKQRGGRASF